MADGDPSLVELVREWVPNVVADVDLGLPAAESAADTFAANAALKARAAARSAGLPCLASDLGLVVHALGGAPGVWSARWAQSGKAFARSLAKIHEAVGDDPPDGPPPAALVFAVAMAWPDGYSEAVEARLEGHVLRGAGDEVPTGWDAVFVPVGQTRPLAELEPAQRRAIDPRPRLVRRLAEGALSGAAGAA